MTRHPRTLHPSDALKRACLAERELIPLRERFQAAETERREAEAEMRRAQLFSEAVHRELNEAIAAEAAGVTEWLNPPRSLTIAEAEGRV